MDAGTYSTQAVAYFTLGSAIVGIIVWFVRLEAEVKRLKERGAEDRTEIAKLQTKLDTHESQTVKELGRVRESLARIEGLLSARPES